MSFCCQILARKSLFLHFQQMPAKNGRDPREIRAAVPRMIDCSGERRSISRVQRHDVYDGTCLARLGCFFFYVAFDASFVKTV